MFATKIFRYSILPACLIIFGKIAGIICVNLIFKYDYVIDYISSNHIVSKILYLNESQAFFSATIGNLTSYIFIFAGQAITILQLYYFNQHFQHPKHLNKMIQLNLTEFFIHTDKLYPLIFSWFIFSWVITVIILKDIYLGFNPIYLGVLSIAISSAYSYLIFNKLEKDINIYLSHLDNANIKI